MRSLKPATLSITKAQKIYGKHYDNVTIITERPAHLRSTNPDEDKELFRQYKRIMRQQTATIKNVLR